MEEFAKGDFSFQLTKKVSLDFRVAEGVVDISMGLGGKEKGRKNPLQKTTRKGGVGG